MHTIERLNLGIVGAGGRGGSFKPVFDHIDTARVYAVCDLDADKLAETAAQLSAAVRYTDYDRMLDDEDLDAVLVCTPMHLHAPHSVAALERGLHVFSEVTPAVSIDQCRDLVAASKTAKGVFMLGENYLYTRENMLIGELVRKGLFGTTYYAEGEYIHELRGLQHDTPWRRRWHTGVNGVTYGTHSLGPILQWMPGERITAVCCAGAGRHRNDLNDVPYEQEDTCVMLGRTSRGGLVKVRLDVLSARPHAMTNYQLQGTDGCYESARAPGERDRVWLRSRSKDLNDWLDLNTVADEHLPEIWRSASASIRAIGHGGGDYFVMREFVDAIHENRPPAIGIHEAMDMTLPGLISQESIAQNGQWLDIPDSRTW